MLNSRLLEGPETDPLPLESNRGLSYKGVMISGIGFTLAPSERATLLGRDPRNGERIFPYLGGKEVNTHPTQSHHRYVIDFGTLSLEEAGAWPELLAIVRAKVKPLRDGANNDVERLKWWQWKRRCPGLSRALAPLTRCLVCARVTKHLMFSFQPARMVLADTIIVIPTESHAVFATLQSRIHEPWARLLSSTLRTDLRYCVTDCFDNYPFPRPSPRAAIPALERVGERLYQARATYMVATQQGLTQTYNALKDPACTDARIVALRSLHEAMDRAVLSAYGWEGIEVPPYASHSAAFGDAVLARLFGLNTERSLPMLAL